jgi:hypothetical protein
MNISELRQKLNESHAQFISTIRNVSDADFTKSVDQKWTAGQQLEHIIKSVAPVNQAFGLPGFALRLLFGKANRASRTYDQLVEKYQGKLKLGGKAPDRFAPAPITVEQRENRIKKLEKLNGSLNKRLAGFSESQLEQFILPHPLLGKLTLREMLYFTIYHAGHHERQVINNLQKQNA